MTALDERLARARATAVPRCAQILRDLDVSEDEIPQLAEEMADELMTRVVSLGARAIFAEEGIS